MAVLSPAQKAAFIEDGWVVVREAFSRETADELVQQVWARVEESPDVRSGWKRKNVQIEECIFDGAASQIFTERYRTSVDELVGPAEWTTSPGFGWVILRFPGHSSPPWRPPESGWHVDGIAFQHHVSSPEQLLVGIELLTDVEPGGGGTVLRAGSHSVITKLLSDAEPHGLSYQELRSAAESIRDLPVVEFVGNAGDVIWMHPHLVHARGANLRDRVRIAGNRCIARKAATSTMLASDRAATPSLVERATDAALDRYHGIGFRS